jgi:uncharacterized protein (DUF1015 family)
MADIKTFPAYRHHLASPADLGAVAAPPYDMLDAAFVNTLYARDEHNCVRLIQNRPEPGDTCNRDRHTRASKLFSQWIQEHAVERDAGENLYLYRQRFSDSSSGQTKSYERTGLIGLVRLTDFSEGVVFPHEYTLSGPKVDRKELLEELKVDTGQIFGLVPDDGAFHKTLCAAKSRILGSFVDGTEVTHELLVIDDSPAIASLIALMKQKTILIADGHHRYETALAYSRESGYPNAAWVMMTLVSMADPGLIIRQFHRGVRRCAASAAFTSAQDLAAFFTMTDLGKASYDTVTQFLSGHSKHTMLFLDAATDKIFGLTVSENGAQYLLKNPADHTSDWNKLNVSIINRLCVEGIMKQELDGKILHDVLDYANDPRVAYDCGRDAQTHIGTFFIAPLTIGSIQSIVAGGERMPQKSTNFYPKLFSGLVYNRLDA